MNINKQNYWIAALVIILGCGVLFSQVKLDVKTKFKQKSELKSIKWGVIYFLKKSGYQVVEVGEHFAVWLVDFQETRKDPDQYTAKLTVNITSPSLFRQKKAINSEVVEVKYRFQPKMLNVDDTGFLEFFKEKYENMTRKEIVRAFHVGRMAAREIKLMLLVLKRRKIKKI
jgi:hypothetical protein